MRAKLACRKGVDDLGGAGYFQQQYLKSVLELNLHDDTLILQLWRICDASVVPVL